MDELAYLMAVGTKDASHRELAEVPIEPLFFLLSLESVNSCHQDIATNLSPIILQVFLPAEQALNLQDS